MGSSSSNAKKPTFIEDRKHVVQDLGIRVALSRVSHFRDLAFKPQTLNSEP